MRTVIQRVSQARVNIQHYESRSIGRGLVILAGISSTDTPEDIQWMAKKIAGMRIFNDEHNKMNQSIGDVGGQVMVVSQFTLIADARKGNRPSFNMAARPEKAIPLYEMFVHTLSELLNQKVVTGEFGASMQVEIINDGPVTIVLEHPEEAVKAAPV